MQRLFRDSKVTRLIKRCNDFGAGGEAGAEGGHEGVTGGGGVGHVGHLHHVGVADGIPGGGHGAVLTHGDDQLADAPVLKPTGYGLHVLHVDAIGYIDLVAGHESGLMLVGGQVGHIGQQLVGQRGCWGGVQHHGDSRGLGPLGHGLNNVHRQLQLHEANVIQPHGVLKPCEVLLLHG